MFGLGTIINTVGIVLGGIAGDWSILATKSVLDFIIVMVMTCAMGKGCIFSAVPVFAFEGVITLLASLLRPLITDRAMDYLSLVGSILIFCVGLNLTWGKKVKVANMLPARTAAKRNHVVKTTRRRRRILQAGFYFYIKYSIVFTSVSRVRSLNSRTASRSSIFPNAYNVSLS